MSKLALNSIMAEKDENFRHTFGMHNSPIKQHSRLYFQGTVAYEGEVVVLDAVKGKRHLDSPVQ